VVLGATHDDAHHAADRCDLGSPTSAGSSISAARSRSGIRDRIERARIRDHAPASAPRTKPFEGKYPYPATAAFQGVGLA